MWLTLQYVYATVWTVQTHLKFKLEVQRSQRERIFRRSFVSHTPKTQESPMSSVAAQGGAPGEKKEDEKPAAAEQTQQQARKKKRKNWAPLESNPVAINK